MTSPSLIQILFPRGRLTPGYGGCDWTDEGRNDLLRKCWVLESDAGGTPGAGDSRVRVGWLIGVEPL